jgi:DNA-binding transcriptional ArsR family regulator
MSDDDMSGCRFEEQLEASSITTRGEVRQDKRKELDTILRVLSDSQRRDILYHLEKRNITDFDSIITGIQSARLNGSKYTTNKQHSEIGSDLLHKQLPLLEDAGFIEFERRSNCIRYTPSELLQSSLTLCANLEFNINK